MKGLCNYCLESDKELESHTGFIICNDCWVEELMKVNPMRMKVKYLTGYDDTDYSECIETRKSIATICDGECYGMDCKSKKRKFVYANVDNDGSLFCLACLKDGCEGFDFRPIDKNERVIHVDLKKLESYNAGAGVVPDQVDEVQIPESQWVRARDYQ